MTACKCFSWTVIWILFSFSVVYILGGCSSGTKTDGSPLPATETVQAEKAQRAIVKIISNGRTGTGFIIAKEGNSVYIITEHHTVEGDNHPKVGFFKTQKTTKSTVLGSGKNIGNQENSVALLWVEEFPTTIELSKLYLPNKPCENAEVFTYHGGDWSKATTNFSKLDGGICIFEGSSVITSGNSGGPLIDKSLKSEQGLIVWAVIAAVDKSVFAVSATHVRESILGIERGIGSKVIELMGKPEDEFTLTATPPNRDAKPEEKTTTVEKLPTNYQNIETESLHLKCEGIRDRIEWEMCQCGEKAQELEKVSQTILEQMQHGLLDIQKKNLLFEKYTAMEDCPRRDEQFGFIIKLLRNM